MMNTNASKLVSIERAMEIMDCYGADTQAWPEDERIATLSLIKASAQLQQHQEQARRLDNFLEKTKPVTTVENSELAARIIAQLPQQESTTPHSPTSS